MKKTSTRLIVVFITSIVASIMVALFLVMPAQAPGYPVNIGMTASQVTSTMGQADRILNHHEVVGVHPNTSVVWYYILPLRPQDFDTHMLVVEINQNDTVIDVYKFSN